MRRVSNILMAALIVSALFFGNCLSCPQMMLAMAGHQPAHSCCHHSTPRIDCHSPVLSHFVKAQSYAASRLAVSGVAPAIAAITVVARPAVASWRAADVAPPGLLSLRSPLRV
jgi:hypothetical protein